jgi:four helix bundle protein
MTLALEDLRILQAAEAVCDNLWKRIAHWGPFARDTVGKQLVEAADSIGANIAESYGRYHFGEKLTFLYYARGSLFETKYWINRARTRELLENETALAYAAELTELARQLNALLAVTRQQRSKESPPTRAVREDGSDYGSIEDGSDALFSPDDLTWLSGA